MVSSAYCDQTNNEKVPPPVKAISTKMEFNRVNCLVWVLHESARSFSHTVAVYALLRTAIELEFFLSHGRYNNPSLVREILSPIINSVEQNIESQLKTRHPKLVEWFRMVETATYSGIFHSIVEEVVYGICWKKKLAKAIRRESVFSGLQTFQDKVQESNCLATLGILAFLGRKTRLFLSGMGIKDLDEQVKDFLSYLECGSLFIYPKFSSLSMNQLFMEVVADEIGWIDFYAAFSFEFKQERRRSKPRAIQAEKEIILHTVFTVCYNVFSGFVHFSSSTQQPLNADLLAFLLRSESLLTSCLEDYWAAYNRSGTTSSSLTLEAQQKVTDLMARGNPKKIPQSGNKLSKASCKVGTETRTLVEAGRTVESEALHQNLLRKSSMTLISTSSDIWMGTQLLFIDIMASLELLLKQMRGRRITERERNKLKQTLVDIASLIPVTILMLLPVSVIGHAAILAAIKKYVPSLDLIALFLRATGCCKQLKRSKKMEVQTPRNQEDASSAISKING
ncbi:hypothetical protein CK203_094930 [Vitis vinifera]|uniref:Uncharacterized protein n=1 Tax=Vitis vinifera TaxID=29760 RepID=A0A438DNA7_VITVI|nr:hypothetical protein CK203_094930 [Vitis vinifera]